MYVEEQAAAPVAAEVEAVLPRRITLRQGVWRFIRRKPLGALGFLLIIFLVAMTLGTPQAKFGVPDLPNRPLGFELGEPWLQRYRAEDVFYNDQNRVSSYEAPSADHWLGTDKAGRDVWARIVNGSRRSVFIGLWAMVLATFLGTTIGVISGYFGKLLDVLVQRVMDALQSFPPLVALILIVSINPLTSGPSLIVAAFGLGLVGTPTVQRIVRGVVLSTREQQYIEAARVIGASDLRTMVYYILPNIAASIIVVFSTGLGVIILAEAALSFVAPDKLPEGPSWGLMLNEAQPVIVDHPWPGLSSAGAIAMAVLGFNLAGDALRDVLDPRLRLT